MWINECTGSCMLGLDSHFGKSSPLRIVDGFVLLRLLSCIEEVCKPVFELHPLSFVKQVFEMHPLVDHAQAASIRLFKLVLSAKGSYLDSTITWA